MGLIADMLLAAGALGAAFYCMMLSRRLKKFNDLERGVGGAVSVLSSQVDDLTRVLRQAHETAEQSGQHLESLTVRAEDAKRKLELQLAAMHDFAEMQAAAQAQARAAMAAGPAQEAPMPNPEAHEAEHSAPAAPTAPAVSPQGARAVRSFFKTQSATAEGA